MLLTQDSVCSLIELLYWVDWNDPCTFRSERLRFVELAAIVVRLENTNVSDPLKWRQLMGLSVFQGVSLSNQAQFPASINTCRF